MLTGRDNIDTGVCIRVVSGYVVGGSCKARLYIQKSVLLSRRVEYSVSAPPGDYHGPNENTRDYLSKVSKYLGHIIKSESYNWLAPAWKFPSSLAVPLWFIMEWHSEILIGSHFSACGCGNANGASPVTFRAATRALTSPPSIGWQVKDIKNESKPKTRTCKYKQSPEHTKARNRKPPRSTSRLLDYRL